MGKVAAQQRVIGIKGGYLHTKLVSDPLEQHISPASAPVTGDDQWRGSYCAGLFGVAPLSPWLAIQLELLYSVKGSRQDTDYTASADPGQLDPIAEEFTRTGIVLSYLEIPVLVRVSPRGGGPFGLLGASFGIPLSQKVSLIHQGVEADYELDELDRADFCLVAGAGVEVDWGEIELRYSHGLRNLEEQGLVRVRTRTWAALTGLRF
jgi:hypothetical protein